MLKEMSPARMWAVFMVCMLMPGGAFGQQETEISGELRSRAEGRDNADFNADREDGTAFVLNRLRLNLERRLGNDIRIMIQVQDARIWGEEANSLNGLRNLDLHQGFMEVDRLGDLPLRVRVGRQELSFGSGRLVSAYDWHNRGRAFDAVSLTLGEAPQNLNLWLAQVRDHNAPNVTRNQEFAGAFYQNKSWLPGLIEAYAMFFYDGRNFELPEGAGEDSHAHDHDEDGNQLSAWTLGGRVQSSRTGSLLLEAEGAYQLGHRGPLDIQAFAFAGEAVLRLQTAGSPELRVGYTYGSGDDDAQDLKLGTFTNLFPDAHSFLGDMDYASWSNIAALSAGISIEPVKKLRLQASYHNFRRASAADAWYRAGGYLVGSPAEIYRSAVTTAGKAIGQEIDIGVVYLYRETLKLRAGLGAFFIGEFVEKTGGFRSDDSIWGYVETGVRF